MDLATEYMGLKLKNPVIASASPLSETLDGIKRLEDAGAAAVVMYSLFEEQIRRDNDAFDRLLDTGTDSFAESLNYFPAVERDVKGPDEYLELLSKAVKATDIPIIGSLNGVSNEGWTDYARLMQEAGAHAVELNIYFIPTDLEMTPAAVEQRYLDILKAVKACVSIPVAVKLSPFFSAIGNMAKRLSAAGANGLVLFNRFFQPDIDLQRLQVDSRATLSRTEEIRLPLLWIAVLYGQVEASLAASRGVHSSDEIIKYLLAGADVVTVASVLMKNGPEYLKVLLDDVQQWLTAREYGSIEEVRGVMSRSRAANAGAFERVNYIKILESYELPVFEPAGSTVAE